MRLKWVKRANTFHQPLTLNRSKDDRVLDIQFDVAIKNVVEEQLSRRDGVNVCKEERRVRSGLFTIGGGEMGNLLLGFTWRGGG